MKTICSNCGIVVSDMKRHKRGFRIKDKKGIITRIPRCIRQHIRKSTKEFKKGIHNGTGKPYSQGY